MPLGKWFAFGSREFIFDWEMTVKDTSLPKPLAENIVLGAEVIGSSFAKKKVEKALRDVEWDHYQSVR